MTNHEKGGYMSGTALLSYLLPALLAAKEAGKAILEVYHGKIDVTYKDDDSPLTMADKRAHSAILNRLTSDSISNIPIISEEGKQTPYEERSQWEKFWLVDPLDGTKEFVKRSDEFTVNIALIHRCRPVVGVVSLPAAGRIYFAAEGLGSYKLEDTELAEQVFLGKRESSQGRVRMEDLIAEATRLPIHQPANRSTDRVNLVGSRSHGAEALGDFVKRMKEQYNEVKFVPAGSALKLCLVAEGRADLYPRFGPTMEWDTAAGHCVVEQSGGTVVSMDGKIPLSYNKRDLHNPYFVCVGKHLRDINLPL